MAFTPRKPPATPGPAGPSRSPSPARDGTLRQALSLGVLALLAGAPSAVQAQSLRYNLGPGSNVGVPTQVEPTDCTTDPKDGSVTCKTKVKNAPSDSPARPQYEPFNN